MDGIRQRIHGIGVVERLGTQGLVQDRPAFQGGTVVNVGVRLHNKDELLAGMVEVELDLLRRGAHGLVASELQLRGAPLQRLKSSLEARMLGGLRPPHVITNSEMSAASTEKWVTSMFSSPEDFWSGVRSPACSSWSKRAPASRRVRSVSGVSSRKDPV